MLIEYSEMMPLDIFGLIFHLLMTLYIFQTQLRKSKYDSEGENGT